MIVTAMEKLDGAALDLRFQGHPDKFMDDLVKKRFCTFCRNLLDCLSDTDTSTSCTDFKLENVGFVTCPEHGTEFRLIDVDSVGTLTFTPGYMPFSEEDAAAFFGVMNPARVARKGEINEFEEKAKWQATVHAAMICVAIFYVDLQGHEIDGTLVLLESLKFNQRVQLLGAILTGRQSDLNTRRLWQAYGAELATFDDWAVATYAKLQTDAGGRIARGPDTLTSMQKGPRLEAIGRTSLSDEDLWVQALSDEERSPFSDIDRMNARTELAIRLWDTHSGDHIALRAMAPRGPGPRGTSVHVMDTGERVRVWDLDATAAGGGSRRSRKGTTLSTVEEGPPGGYTGGGYR